MITADLATSDPAAVHQCLIYHDDAEFLAGTVPYLRGAVLSGGPVLAVLGGANRQLAAQALGAGIAAAVHWGDPGVWYRYPTQSLRRAREFTDRHGAGTKQICLLGEPVWSGRSAAEWSEWTRYEAIINVAFPGSPVVCAYDARSVGEETLAAAAHTHPVNLMSSARRPNPAYVDPADFLRRCGATALGAPPSHASVLSFTGDLRAIRLFIGSAAERTGIEPDRIADLVLAVNEAATNAIEHGGGRGALRSWAAPAELICEVTSLEGQIDDPFAGHLPPDPHSPRGRGLWLIRELVDLVEIRNGPTGGVTVRMHLFHPAEPG